MDNRLERLLGDIDLSDEAIEDEVTAPHDQEPPRSDVGQRRREESAPRPSRMQRRGRGRSGADMPTEQDQQAGNRQDGNRDGRGTPPQPPTGHSPGGGNGRFSFKSVVWIVALTVVATAGIVFMVGRPVDPPSVVPVAPPPVVVVIAATAIPTLVAAPVSTATPSATVRPSSTPTIIPTPYVAYRIDSLDVRQSTSGDSVTAEWHLAVSNVAALPSDRTLTIQMPVDGGEPESIAFVSGPDTGKAQTYVFDTDLRPGRHLVVISVGDAMRETTLDVPAGNALVSMLTPTPPAVPRPNPTPNPVPTPTVVSQPTPNLTPNPLPTPTVVPKPKPTPNPAPTPTSIPQPVFVRPTPASPASSPAPLPIATASPTAAPLATVTPSPTPHTVPHLKHLELKQYMLELIDAEREKASLNELELGENNGAQVKADAALLGCHWAHFELTGLNPWMHYHLEGGYQSMGENTSGVSFCLTPNPPKAGVG